jgi:O-antigen/teichoic acid export membrane protein
MPAAPPDSTALGADESTASAAAARPGTGSDRPLRALAVRASLFEVVGYGAGQVIRLGSNLILSRLLFPEAFGLVALVNIFNVGLQMMSDVGIAPAVIQSTRGDEVRFLNTAWTISAVRGFLLYLVALVLAWPLAALYREPQLAWLIVAGSISVVLAGLSSTSLFTLRRRLEVGQLTLIELGSQVVSVAVMVTWAYLHPTVWVLVGGSLAYATAKAAATHLIDVGYRNRFERDAESQRAIFHFGKWIFGASAVNFVSRQGDRLLVGRLLGVTELGIYSIAVLLSESVSAVVTAITHGVLFPVLSRVRVEGDARLRQVYYRARLALDGLSLPALGILTVLGPWVVHLLYDQRYAGAGWMLQAFALRVAMGCMLTPCETCLFSMGQTRYGFYQNVVRTAWIVVAIPVGWHFLGLRGFVYAAGLSELPLFFVLWPAFRASGMLRLALELRGLGFYAAGLLIGWLLAGIAPA